MTPKRSFELIDQYARKQHLCFLAEMFLNRIKTEYILCFRPAEAANNPDRYACRYLQLEIGTVETLGHARELNESTKALLDKEIADLKSST
jgi:hypothetical protein